MKADNLTSIVTTPKVVEVFKTNVNDELLAFEIIKKLNGLFPTYKINFDLDDCDKILRIAYPQGDLKVHEVIQIVRGFNRTIQLLE